MAIEKNEVSNVSNDNALKYQKAIKFIVILGIVSLFADMTYEGARSIAGAYLAILGASATAVSSVAGFGEFIGYGLRLVSGYLADRSEKYWTITIVGYLINLCAVPALALTNHWPAAAILIILERLGKAIRIPSRDAMLSNAGHIVGLGWGFGLHEALDKIGAMLGPLLVALVLYFHGSYREGFAVLAIPALLAMIALVLAFSQFPNPRHLEVNTVQLQTKNMTSIFWIYLIGASFVAIGYADFPLIAYHFQKTALLSKTWIPIDYGLAMGACALVAPILGHIYDRKGMIVLIFITLCSAIFAPLVFLGGFALSMIGTILWGVGVGAQESLMRAVVGDMVAINKRASAYGVFNMGYGVFWFLGSVAMGLLYDKNLDWLVFFSLFFQLMAVPWLCVAMWKLKPAS